MRYICLYIGTNNEIFTFLSNNRVDMTSVCNVHNEPFFKSYPLYKAEHVYELYYMKLSDPTLKSCCQSLCLSPPFQPQVLEASHRG